METQKSITEMILNGITVQEFIVYFIFGLLGIIASMIIEIYKKKAKHKDKDESFQFSTGYWIKDNFLRFILSVFAVIIGILFSKDLLDINLNNFTALIAGFNTDKIIEAFKLKISSKK